MAKLPEDAEWEAGIYQIEQTDPVVGGPPDLAKGQGITNVPARQLANRTAWLKGKLEALQKALTDLTNGAPGALNTLKELAAAIGNDPNFAATSARQMATKLTKDADASVKSLTSAGGLYVNGGHVSDGDNDYGLIISAYEPAISLLDRSDNAGSVQIRAQPDGSIWFLRDTRNDGTIGHDSSKTTKIVVKFSPDGPIFYNADGDQIAHIETDGSIWTKLYGALENHFAAKASLDALTNGAPGALNTLKELAAAIGNDPNFAATSARQMATKLTKDADASVKSLTSAGTISGKRAALTDSVEIRAPKDRDAYIDLTSDGHTGDFDWRIVANRARGHFDIYADTGADPSVIGLDKDGTIYTKKYGTLENHFAARNTEAYAVGSYTIALLNHKSTEKSTYRHNSLVSGSKFSDDVIMSDIGSDCYADKVFTSSHSASFQREMGITPGTIPGTWRIMTPLYAFHDGIGTCGWTTLNLILRVA